MIGMSSGQINRLTTSLNDFLKPGPSEGRFLNRVITFPAIEFLNDEFLHIPLFLSYSSFEHSMTKIPLSKL